MMNKTFFIFLAMIIFVLILIDTGLKIRISSDLSELRNIVDIAAHSR